jgi:hypothetical protein
MYEPMLASFWFLWKLLGSSLSFYKLEDPMVLGLANIFKILNMFVLN